MPALSHPPLRWVGDLWGSGVMDKRGRLALADLCTAIVDCEHKTAPPVPVGIPSIRTTDIKAGRLNLETANRVSEETYRAWTARMKPVPGDLILAREAPVGEVGIIPPGCRVCLGQRTVLLRTDPNRLDSRYLLYLLLTDEMRHEMASRAEGSVVSHLNVREIRELEIPCPPPLPGQHAIAAILGALDDKIALNRRMNQTLEAMTQALFRSWFVDFDPVRAKMAGRQPAGMDAETAALFPDGLEDSPQECMPAGWSIVNLGEMVSLHREGLNPGQYAEESFYHFSIPAYDAGQTPTLDRGEEIKSAKFTVPRTVVLLSKINPRIPRVWLPDVTGDHQSVCSTEFMVLVPRQEDAREYIYCLVCSAPFADILVGLVTGTSSSHQRVQPDHLLGIPIVAPPAQTITRFATTVRPLFQQVAMNRRQSRTLATLRDTLLPKLLSGELRVPEAEEMVGAT